MFYQSVANKRAFIKAEGITHLFHALRTYLEDSKVSEIGVKTLRNLCSIGDPYAAPQPELEDDHRLILSNSGVIKLILEISKSHQTNEVIHDHILWTFLNVTINSRTRLHATASYLPRCY